LRPARDLQLASTMLLLGIRGSQVYEMAKPRGRCLAADVVMGGYTGGNVPEALRSSLLAKREIGVDATTVYGLIRIPFVLICREGSSKTRPTCINASPRAVQQAAVGTARSVLEAIVQYCLLRGRRI
jgi:hypothetical protein